MDAQIDAQGHEIPHDMTCDKCGANIPRGEGADVGPPPDHEVLCPKCWCELEEKLEE